MSPERSIAHYRLTTKLGEGGMGAVWRATDTKLGRDVAIKILPDGFAADPDRLARFTREAQVLASLNHPNIAAIYGGSGRTVVHGRSGQRFFKRDASFANIAQPALWIFLETAPQQPAHHGRRGGRQTTPSRIFEKHRGQRFRHRFARIERAARKHLGEHRAECPDIGAAVHRLTLGLLGAHVRRRPHDYASLRSAHGKGG